MLKGSCCFLRLWIKPDKHWEGIEATTLWLCPHGRVRTSGQMPYSTCPSGKHQKLTASPSAQQHPMEQTWLEAICYSHLLENTKIYESEQLLFRVMSESWTCTMLSLGYVSSLWVDWTSRNTNVFSAGDSLLPRSEIPHLATRPYSVLPQTTSPHSNCTLILYLSLKSRLHPFFWFKHIIFPTSLHAIHVPSETSEFDSVCRESQETEASCAMLVWEKILYTILFGNDQSS